MSAPTRRDRDIDPPPYVSKKQEAPVYVPPLYSYPTFPYTTLAPEYGKVEHHFTVTLILNNTREQGGALREYHNFPAITAKHAAMIARERFRDRDYEFIKVEDNQTKRTYCWEKTDLEQLTGREGMR